MIHSSPSLHVGRSRPFSQNPAMTWSRSRWSVAREGLDDHPVDRWKRSEPTEWVGGVKDSQSPDGRLVDLTRSRSARAHALLPAVCLQQLQERRVRDRRPAPLTCLDLFPYLVEPTRRRRGDDLLDASELGPCPVREPEVALGCGKGTEFRARNWGSSGPGTTVVHVPELGGVREVRRPRNGLGGGPSLTETMAAARDLQALVRARAK